MNIVARPDLTDFAPPECAYYAIDTDTYDGPGSPIGHGPTAEAAMADLALQIDPDPEEEACAHEWTYTGTAYGGDDVRWHGEGRCFCIHCGADGDG